MSSNKKRKRMIKLSKFHYTLGTLIVTVAVSIVVISLQHRKIVDLNSDIDKLDETVYTLEEEIETLEYSIEYISVEKSEMEYTIEELEFELENCQNYTITIDYDDEYYDDVLQHYIMDNR